MLLVFYCSFYRLYRYFVIIFNGEYSARQWFEHWLLLQRILVWFPEKHGGSQTFWLQFQGIGCPFRLRGSDMVPLHKHSNTQTKANFKNLYQCLYSILLLILRTTTFILQIYILQNDPHIYKIRCSFYNIHRRSYYFIAYLQQCDINFSSKILPLVICFKASNNKTNNIFIEILL